MSTTPASPSRLSRVFRSSSRKPPSIESDRSSTRGKDEVAARRRSTDSQLLRHDPTEEPNSLQRLLSLSRRKKKEILSPPTPPEDELERGRQVAARGTLDATAPSVHSRAGTASANGSTSSLVTYDSDHHSVRDDPPPLVSHPSHKGFLTLTAPDAQPAADGMDPVKPESDAILTGLSPSVTLPAKRPVSPGPEKRKGLSANPFKGAFRSPSRRATSPASNSSSDKDSKSLSSRFGRGKDDTKASDRKSFVGDETIVPVPVVPQSVNIVVSDADAEPQRGRPSTSPAASSATTPSLSQAPETTITPPTPTLPAEFIPVNPESPSAKDDSLRRRSQSLGQDTKYAHLVSHPLTPTIEETVSATPTPNGQGNAQSSFFSSMFSAAQNAATSFSNTIANPLAPGSKKSKDGISKEPEKDEQETVEITHPPVKTDENNNPRPAVETLGKGELNLGHLGITADTTALDHKPVRESARSLSKALNPIQRAPSSRAGSVRSGKDSIEQPTPGTPTRTNGEELTTTDSVTSDKNLTPDRPINNKHPTPVAEDSSVYAASHAGDKTPPGHDDGLQVNRTSSIRSRVTPRRRKRGSSATTSAVSVANGNLAQKNSSAPRLTGFAIASAKRNKDFHALFKSVPEDDYLIEDYGCALQREILLQGRMYISEGHICFNSNIFGWVTTLVISFDEVMSLEKKNTAVVFPNAIVIQTLHAKNVFASFISRDSTYDLLLGIWKISHPSLTVSPNGHMLAPASSVDHGQSDDGSEYDEDDSEEDDDDDDDDDGVSAGMTETADAEPVSKVTRKTSATVGDSSASVKVESAPAPAGDFPGPATHAPTDCGDADQHFERMIITETIPAPLGKVYSQLFGSASHVFMTKFLLEDQKCTDLSFEDERGLSDEVKTRSMTYIKPLNGPIGPKQTKCISTETLDKLDYEKAIGVTVTTQTPDVPSGNSFSVKTKYCLMWGEKDSTKLIMTCTIEWTAKSWLKGPIEKGATDGQITYAKDILAALTTAVKGKVVAAKNGKGGKRRRKNGSDSLSKEKYDSSRGLDGAADAKSKAAENWGLLEPLRPTLGPVLQPLRPLVESRISFISVILFLIVIIVRQSRVQPTHNIIPHRPITDRLATYEAVWLSEEARLWDWVEERVGMQALGSVKSGDDLSKLLQEKRKRSVKLAGLKGKGEPPKLGKQELKEAVRITEERLKGFKELVEDVEQ